MRRLIFVTLAACLCGLPGVAGAQSVYFSVGPEIRTMNLPNTNSSLLHTSTAFVGDLARCSDNHLYFVEKTTPLNFIRRLDLATNSVDVGVVASAATIREIRLTPRVTPEGELTCDVLYATPTGVFKVSGENAPINVTGVGASGLAVAFNGDIKASNTSVGLNVANGGAGSLAALASLPTGAICKSGPASSPNKVICTDKTDSNPADLATLPAQDKVQYCEFLSNDTMVCAASVDPENEISRTTTIDHNGTLRLITAANGFSQIFAAPRVSNKFMPVVGVAVGPSNSEIVTSPATGTATTHHVDFGPVSFDVTTPQSCSLGIQLRQLTAAQAATKLASAGSFSGNSYLPDPGSGGESWIDNVDVTVKGGNCGLNAATPARIVISQFNDASPNKAVIHCTGASCDVVTEGNFPYSAPDDDGNSGLPDNFSDFLTAAIDSENHNISFKTPLANAPIVQGDIDTEIAQAPVFNATGGLSLRFDICGATCASSLPPETPNPPMSGAGLSVTRLVLNAAGTAVVDRVNCDVDDSGGSTPDRPVFRIAGQTHNFNLNTPLLGDPQLCGLNGVPNGTNALFAFTVFSHGGEFNKTTILAFLRK